MQLINTMKRNPTRGLRSWQRGLWRWRFAVALTALSQYGTSARADERAADTAGATPIVEEIVVSASRIQSANFEAPTPVLSVDTELMERRGTVNIADIINELPAVRSFSTPASEGQSSNVAGQNTVSLRGLGFQRTLVLLDGHRVAPQTAEGRVDINAIPQALLSGVDVVTGGASAAWGSDAVAGVINLRLDRKVEGVRTNFELGSSEHDDGREYKAALAAGTELFDGRSHVEIGVDFQKNPNNVRCEERSWCAPGYQLVPNPSNPTQAVIRGGARSWLGVDGGAIIGGPAPIALTQFGPNGTFGPFNTGSGITGLYVLNGGGSDFEGRTVLQVAYERESAMLLSDTHLTDRVTAFADVSFARTASVSPTITPATGFLGGATLLSGNPYLPAAFQNILTANSIPSFALFRSNGDLGETTADIESRTLSGTVGLRGEFGGDWRWEAYVQYGRTSAALKNDNNLIVANFLNATDAVLDANGQIVCRGSLNGTAPGCVPINLIGPGAPSAKAIAYVMGTSRDDIWNDQQVSAANINGPVSKGWAGSILGAAGVEYRKERGGGAADALSQESGYLIANLTPDRGEFHVKEAFGELNVPLLADQPFVRRLELNGAVRFTDYSTSGQVTTWKGGLIFQPVTDWHLRGTYSRDLRAPDIRELFSGNRLQFANVIDPFNGSTTTLTQVKVGGNAALKAEWADTRSLGVIFHPEGPLSGLTASMDYFDISLRDAITSLGAQTTVDGCYAGNGALCSQITRNAQGTITSINATTINAARLETSGVDFVGRYATTAWVPGKVDLSLTATFVDKYLLSTDGVHTTNHVGEVGLNLLANGVEASTPHWVGTTGIGYSIGKMGFFAQVRYVGGGKYDNSYTAADIDPNEFSGRTYLDLSAHVALVPNVELYGGMNNVFDRAPPLIPGTFPGQPPTNTLLYDTMGRYLFVGVRASFK